MSTYGSSSYGSDSFGGGGGAGAQVFFLASESLVIGSQSRTVAYGGLAELYAVHVHMDGFFTDPAREARIYTSTSEGESPQLQAILGEALESECIIGARAFITVEIVSTENLDVGGMLITGREVVV